VTMFEDAKPRPLVERRAFREPVDDDRRFREMKDDVSRSRHGGGRWRRFTPLDMAEYADLMAERTARRELASLRRRVEEWAADLGEEYALDEIDPETDRTARLLRDLAVVIDERILSHGGTDEPE
jgi:hypothetical protein